MRALGALGYIYLRAGGVPTRHTHTNGTAYTRGTYSRVHTQTHTNTNKHTARPDKVRCEYICVPSPSRCFGRCGVGGFTDYPMQKLACFDTLTKSINKIIKANAEDIARKKQ